ncbi:MAG TPA: tyrosine--tRNA ligase [Candidatus Saccharimonadales bacterium]|nr:tyrosine--tRNA ligase [Candidatus Saccharimonadales bacterium]
MILSEELNWRGFVNQTTFKSLDALDGKPLTFYFGVDPSADSMTIGNLAAAMMVKTFMKHGHKAVLLVGGATGLIGDPDGKAEERSLKTEKEIAANKKAIAAQYSQLFNGQPFALEDNYDWFKHFMYLEFLRDVGKHVPMRQMLGRDFVQKRLGEEGAGISYAEFSYVLIQAYDFLYLHEKHGVTLQLCGSDQWGNSIAGVDLIRRKTGAETHVFSAPLIVNKATGQKFGKSEAGAVWLDPTKTSPYQFYQFWLNADDDSVADYLKIFTELDKNHIDQVMEEFGRDHSSRLAQKTLAYEVTKLVHGEAVAKSQKNIAAVLFGGEDSLELGADEFKSLKKELPTAKVPARMTSEHIVQALVQTGLAASKTEARRFIESGAIYINNEKMTADFLFDTLSGNALVRRGKNKFAVLELG